MDELNMTNVETTTEEENEMEFEPIEVFEEDAGNGLASLVVIVGAIGTAVVALIKNKDKIAEKIDQRRIKKLEKKGYTVSKLVEDDAHEDVNDETKN